MDYEEALEVGLIRAKQAAEMLRRWTGARACEVCAVKPAWGDDPRRAENWRAVGQRSLKEIARDDGYRGGGNYHVLIVDEDGAIKAASCKRFPLDEALRLAERLPLAVWSAKDGELGHQLGEEDLRRMTRHHALHVEV